MGGGLKALVDCPLKKKLFLWLPLPACGYVEGEEGRTGTGAAANKMKIGNIVDVDVDVDYKICIV